MDKIFAEFTKVNRTRLKFKCDFKNAILHINGYDYVIKNLQGEIDYWPLKLIRNFSAHYQ